MAIARSRMSTARPMLSFSIMSEGMRWNRCRGSHPFGQQARAHAAAEHPAGFPAGRLLGRAVPDELRADEQAAGVDPAPRTRTSAAEADLRSRIRA